MRLLQLVQAPQRRGAEVFAHQLSGELRRRGHAVSIVYLYGTEAEADLPLHRDDRLLGGDPDHRLERLAGFHPALARRLRAALSAFAPDVVQVNGARTVKYGALAARCTPDRAWALVYRNIGDPRRWLRGPARKAFYRRLVMPRVDGVVAVSETTLAAVREVYRLRVPAVAVPRAVDPSALGVTVPRATMRRELATPAGCPVAIWIGSMSPEKRTDRLLRVISSAAARVPDLHLWVVGDGPERARAEALAHQAGQASRIRFAGRQPAVGDFLAAADLMLLTSDTEGLPGVVLEAAWFGVPAVATRVGGIGEFVVDGENGVLAAPEDEEALARGVVRLATETDLRAALGRRARERVRARHDLGEAAASYLEFYRRVRTNRRGARAAGPLPERLAG